MLSHLPIVRLGVRLSGQRKPLIVVTDKPTRKKRTESELTSALVADRLVVGELVASEESNVLADVAAGAVEGRSTTERRTLKKR